MSTPENEIALNNEDNDNPRNLGNSQENAQTQESDLSGDGNDVQTESDQPDVAGLERAYAAAEPSYTLNLDDEEPTDKE